MLVWPIFFFFNSLHASTQWQTPQDITEEFNTKLTQMLVFDLCEVKLQMCPSSKQNFHSCEHAHDLEGERVQILIRNDFGTF